MICFKSKSIKWWTKPKSTIGRTKRKSRAKSTSKKTIIRWTISSMEWKISTFSSMKWKTWTFTSMKWKTCIKIIAKIKAWTFSSIKRKAWTFTSMKRKTWIKSCTICKARIKSTKNPHVSSTFRITVYKEVKGVGVITEPTEGVVTLDVDAAFVNQVFDVIALTKFFIDVTKLAFIVVPALP